VHRALEETGDGDWFLGQGMKAKAKDSLRPTEAQIRETIVPALLQALEGETNNDIVTGAMIALAKIGDGNTESNDSKLAGLFSRFLADKNQEIAETAAVAMGILGNPRSIRTLASLLADTDEGRRLVAESEVGYRTRAFAAYGLGLIGARTAREEERKEIVAALRQALETDSTKTRDLKVSCVVAMGLVPLATIDPGARPEKKGDLAPPESSRTAQLDYLLGFLQDEEQHYLVRAHCPCALARLLSGLPDEQYESYRERLASDLLERLDPKKKEKAQLVQSAILALGMIGTNDDGSPLDKRIRESVASAIKEASDQQARNFSLIALAKMGGTLASKSSDAEGGIEDVTRTLVTQLTEGRSGARPWAGLACGVLGRKLVDANSSTPRISTLQGSVRASLQDEKDPERIGALAISAGIMGDIEAARLLMGHLAKQKDEAQGYVAIGLGLMNARDAVGQIQALVEESKYKPERLKQSAIALGLLGDKEVVPKLVGLLKEARGLAAQASIASALGFIGDRRSIDPLVQMLHNGELTGAARGFAAVALGIIGDKESLPWNAKIGIDLNYRASTETLTNRSTGILDIL
jgi:HEAT repeat protein